MPPVPCQTAAPAGRVKQMWQGMAPDNAPVREKGAAALADAGRRSNTEVKPSCAVPQPSPQPSARERRKGSPLDGTAS